MSMYVTIIENDRLPEFAEKVFEETEVGAQYDNGTETAIVWLLDGPAFLQSAHLRRVLGMPTVPWREALPVLSDVFGLHIPCL